jgi:transposase
MHVQRIQSKQRGTVYQQILLRESYREPGEHRSKVKKRTLLNLTKYPENVVKAIELALKHRHNLPELERLLSGSFSHKQGPAIGAVWVLQSLSQDTGVAQALGKSRNGLLCLWMVMARLIDQGSRLSATRLARTHSVAELLGIDGFTEDDLYGALDWLSEHQDRIEHRLYKHTFGDQPPRLFLYDVTSSYLEGDGNELGDWGYNRDKKRGRKQIVIGLLCSADGTPVAVRVFRGNTSDVQTFAAQVAKLATDFGCEQVTMVGDRGMIKNAQVQELQQVGFSYITAITKPQIRSLLKDGAIQLGLFDAQVCEVEHDGVRYILRRNPLRAAEMAASRMERIRIIEAFAEEQRRYLAAHPRADFIKALKRVWDKQRKFKVEDVLEVTYKDKAICVERDEQYLAEVAALDGCYVIKTDLPVAVASAQTVHDRYKDLAYVEQAFRACKTGHLEVRPVYVRKESRTRGHVCIVMLAYLLRRKLAAAWRDLDITVQEGVRELTTLCAIEHEFDNGQPGVLVVPAPRESVSRLFTALGITPPVTVPRHRGKVDTNKTLPKRRK